MNRKAKSACTFVFVMAASSAWADDLIKGRVVDIGLPEQANGIGGVTVVISDEASQKLIGSGVTDATGAYQIEVRTLHPVKLVAKFSKIGYFARPTYLSVAILTQPQPSVKLSRESAPEGYYKKAAENIWNDFRSDPNTSATSFSAVTALSITDKQAVFNALKLKDRDAYMSLEVADQTYQATQEFLSKYNYIDGSTGKGISAYANYGSNGTVRLFGAVPNADRKREFEKAIKSFDAVRKVQNDLLIAR